MKKLLPIFSLILLASCGEKGNSKNATSANILENLTYSVDTVVVDPGEELLALNSNSIGSWNISADQSRMFIFSSKSNSIHEIDLDKLTVTDRYSFETEGPDGTGNQVMGIQELDDHQFVFSTYNATYLFDKSGKKTKGYHLKSNEIEGIVLDDDYILNHQAQIYGDGSRLYVIHETALESQLMSINLQEMKADTLSLPKLSKTKDFSTMLLLPENLRFYEQRIYTQYLRDKVLAYSRVTNAIYVYDPEMNSIQEKSFAHKMIPLEKEWKNYPKEASSLEEFNATMEDINVQINFGKFFWDDTRQLYFRLSQKGKKLSIPGENRKYETFIHAYNENWQLVGESKLDARQAKLYDSFFKDGKLYSYVNVDDELGFAVFTFVFN